MESKHFAYCPHQLWSFKTLDRHKMCQDYRLTQNGWMPICLSTVYSKDHLELFCSKTCIKDNNVRYSIPCFSFAPKRSLLHSCSGREAESTTAELDGCFGVWAINNAATYLDAVLGHGATPPFLGHVLVSQVPNPHGQCPGR